MMNVWYKVDGLEADLVEVQEGAVIAQFRTAVKSHLGQELQGIAARDLEVYFPTPSDRLDPGRPVPGTTSFESPVIIASPRPPKQAKRSLDFSTLKEPLEIRPPPSPDLPRFVCPEGWKREVELQIQTQLDTQDFELDEGHRVEPLAVSRCSRGGKTRALYEMANMNFTYGDEHVAVIFVSFNDYSTLDQHDQEKPLEALLLRIAFAAFKDLQYKPGTTKEQFEAFRKLYHVTATDVLSWLGQAPALLIVDELNNLRQIAQKNSAGAAEIVTFIKQNFLAPSGRHFIFSSHILSTLECFGVYMEYSTTSDRNVLLQELPLVDDLSSAKTLNKDLKGAREAIYYGLMPGLIHDRSKRHNSSVFVKWSAVMTEVNEKSPDERKKTFFCILKSLLDGDVRRIPTEFHAFLDATGSGPGSERVRWSPHHLEFVLSRLILDDLNDDKLANSMASLCKKVLESKESSGDGWEGLFVLFLLARCITKSWEEPILSGFDGLFASNEQPVVLFDSPFLVGFKFYDQCECWADLKKEIVPGEAPAISIYYPAHAKFKAYDVILVTSENKVVKRIIGYQLKEGSNDATQHVEPEFHQSFALKGVSPSGSRCKNNWTIPNDQEIDKFFGVSGAHWTPKQWKKLLATVAVPQKE
jgi:hypothetical protein